MKKVAQRIQVREVSFQGSIWVGIDVHKKLAGYYRILLVTLRGTCMLATARAAASAAAKRIVFHRGERQWSGDKKALRMATAEIRQHVSHAALLAPPAVKDSFNTLLLQSNKFQRHVPLWDQYHLL